MTRMSITIVLAVLLGVPCLATPTQADVIQTYYYDWDYYYYQQADTGFTDWMFTFERYEGELENLMAIVFEVYHTSLMSAWVENWNNYPLTGNITYGTSAALWLAPGGTTWTEPTWVISEELYDLAASDYSPLDPHREAGPDYQAYNSGPDTSVLLYSVPEEDFYKFTLDYYQNVPWQEETLRLGVYVGEAFELEDNWAPGYFGYAHYTEDFIRMTYVEKSSSATPEPFSLALAGGPFLGWLLWRCRRVRRQKGT